jgi:hypothetical protein
MRTITKWEKLFHLRHPHRQQKALSSAVSLTGPEPSQPASGDSLTPGMNLRIAAIRTGTDPVRKLTSGSFQRWLETPIICPKCDATYLLAVDYDHATDRWFPENSRPLITLLKKAIFLGHSTDHRVTHFETEGVIVESVTPTSVESASNKK